MQDGVTIGRSRSGQAWGHRAIAAPLRGEQADGGKAEQDDDTGSEVDCKTEPR